MKYKAEYKRKSVTNFREYWFSKNWYLLVILLVSVVNITIAQVQELSFHHIAGSNGISVGKVNAIIQDKYGFMWFSDQTNRCIIRYDGNFMKRYSYDDGKQNTLGGYYPECFATDSSGIIWIGFYGQGIDRFDPDTNTFTHYSNNPQDPGSLANNLVSAILIDHSGNVWIGTDGGLDLFNTNTGNFKHYQNDPSDSSSLSHNVVRTIYEDQKGEIWVGTGLAFNPDNKGGLNRFNREKGTFIRYMHDPNDPTSLVDNKVRSILEDSYGNFWVGTRGDGLHKMNRSTGTFERLSFDPAEPKKLSRPPVSGIEDHITFLVEDKQKHIWIGTLNNGIARYNPLNNSIQHYGKTEDQSGTFTDNSSWYAYPTNDGIVWFSTQYDTKLIKVDLYNTVFPVKTTNYRLFSVLEDNSPLVWLGTNDGLIREDRKSGNRIVFRNEPNNLNSLSGNTVNVIKKDRQGNLLLGTNHGLDHYNPVTGKFKRYQLETEDGSEVKSIGILCILEDSEGTIWVGTDGEGSAMLDKEKRSLTKEYLGYNAYFRLYSMVEDHEHIVWMGTANGLSSFRLNDPDDSQFFFNGLLIYNLYIDSDSVLWACTDNGLHRFDREEKRFYRIDIEASVSSIMEDGDKNLWLGTTIGLVKFNKRTGQKIIFGVENGIIGEQWSMSNINKFHDGKLIVGFEGMDEICEFNPENVIVSSDTSKVFFTDFRLNGVAIIPAHDSPLDDSIIKAEKINLNYDQNIFSFGFTELDFRSNNQMRMLYRLDDYDLDWRQSSAGEQVNYYKVPPGKYTFRINAANSKTGLVAEKSIEIIIKPPWWTTWWAYSLYGLIFIGGAFMIDRVQRRRIITKERTLVREKELEQAREIEKAYTELKATQSQLIQSEKMASLGELTAGIAHEIQNPLNFVNNFSEVNSELIEELKAEWSKSRVSGIPPQAGENTKRDLKLEEELLNDIRENEEKIKHHGQRAENIVKGMLQHSQTSTGQKEPTDINALADEYLRLAYHGLRAKDKSFNADFHLELDKNLPNINVIPQDIGRVLLNLINNAFYAVDKKAKQGIEGYKPIVSVRTNKLANKIEIRVKDNGEGIPQKVRDKIFQPFFTTKPTGSGTGLGLSLSYDIIKAHGGEIKLESKEREGSTFEISLPFD